MKTKNMIIAALALMILGVSLPQPAPAHMLWINATSHLPAFHERFGAQTKTYLGWGHLYPVADFLSPNMLLEYCLIDPAGKKLDIRPVETTGFLAAGVRMKQPGQYRVSVILKPGFYTMYEENGAIRHHMGPKAGLARVILSQYYEQYAKSLIIAGDVKGTAYKTPVGHKLEIIPLENPATLGGGAGKFMLPIKILFNGEPARFCKVYATYSGYSSKDDFAHATIADGEGVAEIRLTHWGPWLIKANHRIPAQADMKDQCNELNYTATLTLEIP